MKVSLEFGQADRSYRSEAKKGTAACWLIKERPTKKRVEVYGILTGSGQE